MLPYNKGRKVVLDPTIKKEKFFFGPVERPYVSAIGEIIDSKYIRNLKAMAYEVKYNEEVKMWFMEKELV